MKIITSPAKLMNVENSTEFLKSTTPKFIEEATLIQSYLKEKSPKYLADLMEISAKLADENWQRNQVWKLQQSLFRQLSLQPHSPQQSLRVMLFTVK